jgi:DNA-binding NarL/FixJ family response regulator
MWKGLPAPPHAVGVVGEAADAESALGAARELRPDRVSLDVGLGDGDGFAIAAALAQGEAAPAVVLTSGRYRRDFEQLIAASAARGLIPKERLSAAALGELLQ